MDSKFVLSVFVVIISFNGIFCQSDSINCTYYENWPYQCNLRINNAKGLNNFTDINGGHNNNRTDDDVRSLYCWNDIISTNIPSIICEKYKNLETLQMGYLQIERIDDYSFKNCRNLTIIYLESNKIATIHEKAFTENLKLYSLILRYNEITTLPENLFLNQQNLYELIVYSNQLVELPENIFQSLTNLSTLDLGNNHLKTFKPKWFESLGMLTHLDLSYSNITGGLSENPFGSMKNLNYIGLYACNLKVIHADTFGILLNAPHINLGSNKIYAIDEKFLDNTGPSYLDMGNNLCASVSLNDNTISRRLMREALKDCFEFYELLEKSSTTTGPPNATTEIASTTSSGGTNPSVDEKIQIIEDEVNHLIKLNEEMTANWKNQYIASAENKDEIAKLQTLGFDLKNEIQHFKESINELQSKIEGGLKDPSPKNIGNNFVSINFDGEYQKHEKN